MAHITNIWVRKESDPEHAEIKIQVPRDGHISDVLVQASSVLSFGGRAAGSLQAIADGRIISNKENVSQWDGKLIVISERDSHTHSSYIPVAQNTSYSATPQITNRSPQRGGSPGGGGQHTCARCHQPITGFKVVLTLPGSPTAVDLHPDCEADYERQNALACNYCKDLILDRLTTLSGEFGTVNLHPQCVDHYKRMPSSQGHGFEHLNRNQVQFPNIAGGSPFQYKDPMISEGSYFCGQCNQEIAGTKVSLKLPGLNKKTDLHPQCEYQYAITHALKCDECRQPMLDGITVLTGFVAGNTTTKQLHPACVARFKETQSGHVQSSWNSNYQPSNIQWKPTEGTPPGNFGGGTRWHQST